MGGGGEGCMGSYIRMHGGGLYVATFYLNTGSSVVSSISDRNRHNSRDKPRQLFQ